MVRSPLTLAALAVCAVPDLNATHVRAHTFHNTGDFDSAVVTDATGHKFIIRIPTCQTAETEQSAELLALRMLSTGARSRLPFTIPTVVGQVPIGSTRAVVYDFLDGHTLFMHDMVGASQKTATSGLFSSTMSSKPKDAPASLVSPVSHMTSSLGKSIAAIHSLPTAFISDAGLPHTSAGECRTAANEIIGKAADTGHLPTALQRRWEEAISTEKLWQFSSVVIHGSLRSDTFLFTNDTVSGVTNWSGLRVGDPATDLSWLFGTSSHDEPWEAVFAAYTNAQHGGIDAMISHRALLYAELELAKWLLYGHQTHQPDIVDDAIEMLDSLVDSVLNEKITSLSPTTHPVLEVSEVETMLKSRPPLRERNGTATPEVTGLRTDSFNWSEYEEMEK